MGIRHTGSDMFKAEPIQVVDKTQHYQELAEHYDTAILPTRPIFVSVSRYEPFGLAVLEAAHAGCALVLSDIPTFRELWQGAASFVIAAGSAAATEGHELCTMNGRSCRSDG